MKISDKQVEALMKLPPFQRYQHSTKLIADTERVYSLLDNEGNWELAEIEGKVSFFIWPHAAYAKPFLIGHWEESIIEEITLKEFNEEISGYLKDNNCLLNVFATNNLSGFVVTVDEFSRDIGIELQKYE